MASIYPRRPRSTEVYNGPVCGDCTWVAATCMYRSVREGKEVKIYLARRCNDHQNPHWDFLIRKTVSLEDPRQNFCSDEAHMRLKSEPATTHDEEMARARSDRDAMKKAAAAEQQAMAQEDNTITTNSLDESDSRGRSASRSKSPVLKRIVSRTQQLLGLPERKKKPADDLPSDTPHFVCESCLKERRGYHSMAQGDRCPGCGKIAFDLNSPEHRSRDDDYG